MILELVSRFPNRLSIPKSVPDSENRFPDSKNRLPILVLSVIIGYCRSESATVGKNRFPILKIEKQIWELETNSGLGLLIPWLAEIDI